MSLGERLMSAINGAIAGWRGVGPETKELSTLQWLYGERWALYSGELFLDLTTRENRDNPWRNDPRIYANTRLLWKHAESVGDYWAAAIYPGALSTTGLLDPDGSAGAIPFVPQAGTQVANRNLAVAIAELWGAWNWQQGKDFAPLYAAVLGDVLTELVDDSDRLFVYPQIVWPGYVQDIELDYVGNVRAYVLEYEVQETQPDGTVEFYTYRKEVDKEAFRHFRDGEPWDRFGDGAVVKNIYGFVPATWSRHRVGLPGDNRGRSALDGSRQAIMELNSILSHALDYQRKAFYAPVGLAGRGARPTTATEVPVGDVGTSPYRYAETFDILPVPEGSQFIQAQFDVGKTGELLERIQRGLLDETPEADFYKKVREMSQVTAPGITRALGDVEKRTRLVAAGHDNQTIKLHQMAIAMCGHRVNSGAWGKDPVTGRQRALSRRQQAFLPFDLKSYAAGELDLMIESRPLIEPTEMERIEILAAKENLQSSVALMEAWGNKRDKVDTIIRERLDATAALMSTGAAAGDVFGDVPLDEAFADEAVPPFEDEDIVNA